MYGGVSGIIWNLFEFMDKGNDEKELDGVTHPLTN
jgi:hypothetical protein